MVKWVRKIIDYEMSYLKS